MIPKLFTVKALAELFHKNEETIRCWIHDGTFPGAFQVKSGWYVPDRDVRKVLKDVENSLCP